MASFKFRVGERVKPWGNLYGNPDDNYGTVISAYESGYTGEPLYEVQWDNGNSVKYNELQLAKLTKVERITDALGIKVGKFFSLVDPEDGENYCSPYSMMENGDILDENGEKLSCDEYAAILKGYAVPIEKAKKVEEINEEISRRAREIESLKERRKELLA